MTEIKAFTGFTTTGKKTTSRSEWNAEDANTESIIKNFGVNFWTDATKKKTIFFPIAGARDEEGDVVHAHGIYYTMGRWYHNSSTTCVFDFYQNYPQANPLYGVNTPSACSVRPVADK